MAEIIKALLLLIAGLGVVAWLYDERARRQ
jgi:hypothetical protein